MWAAEIYTRNLILVVSFVGALCFPTHWKDAPDTLDWYTKDNKTIINPWSYIHRLGLYKIILKNTESCMTKLGMHQRDDPLWGLPIQHGWQFDSLRLKTFNSSVKDNCNPEDELCISALSWWADMNYHLAVVPFLGMVHAGYFNESHYDLQLELPLGYEDETKFCNSVTSCLKHAEVSLISWSEAFKSMKDCHLEEESPQRSDSHSLKDPQWRPDSLDKIIHLIWKAHIHSLEGAEPLFEDELAFMSLPEQNFGRNWANIVEFIGATRFLTSYEETQKFQHELLPNRILRPSDKPPHIPDMTPAKNNALSVMNTLHYFNDKSGGRLLAFWERTMCSKTSRKNGRYILANIATNPWGALMAVLRLIYDLIFIPCDPDWS